MKATELIILTGNVVEENAPGIGGWGGTCRCPDGLEYQVADKGACTSLECENGEMVGDCIRHGGAWSYNRVTCAPGKK